MNNTAYGIYIGNTNMSLAVCKGNDFEEIIVNEAGGRVTPAVLTIFNGETIVGLPAVSKKNTSVVCNKSIFNKTESNLEMEGLPEQNKNIHLTVHENEIKYCIPVGENVTYMTPYDIFVQFFKKLNSMVCNLNTDSMKCVLLAPSSFSEEKCYQFKTAAEEGGWQVLQIINEMSAAVLAYSLFKSRESSQLVLVYRLGGTSCEVALYELSEGMLYLLQSQYSDKTRGMVLTEVLSEYLADEFFKKYKLNPKENKRSMDKLWIASENCIHILSKMQSANCYLESLQDGMEFSINVTRARFEFLINPHLKLFTEPLKALLNSMNSEKQIDKVILCGGPTNIPKLKTYITNYFDTGVSEIFSSLNAEEIMAQGAARQCYYLLDNEVKEFVPRSTMIPTVCNDPTDQLEIVRPD